MNVVIAYLDTMFSAYPQTPRLLEAKAELRGMMEDAYAGLIAEGRSENEAVGQVIRDFGNLDELAPVLGITSDLAPGTESVAAPIAGPAADTAREGGARSTLPADRLPVVTLEEARAYAAAKERTRFRVAAAVVLFVLSPAVLMVLTVAAQNGLVPLTQTAAAFIGILILLVLIAIGVTLTITASRETAPYERLADGRFTPDPEVGRWAAALGEAHERARIRALGIAITLWVLAPVPLLGFALLLVGSPVQGFWTTVGVALVLVFVATGLGILLPRTWAHTISEQLDRRAGRVDEEGSLVSVVAAIYWPSLTAVFLAWSFIGNAWYISWVVWPIGAVAFGAIAGGISALEAYRNRQASAQ
ncbi:permease prefix domain 1-containing protein [Agromyces sp. LHK192]|uniref:permease prefix domain 1-containing protein n=1 Tax=Agromyces sp. LHK192 TaxID=2498704 RepID=UPI000FD8E0DC|nr:permease prefix domain 1-containing protein [Agromyces sp. LHK192]